MPTFSGHIALRAEHRDGSIAPQKSVSSSNRAAAQVPTAAKTCVYSSNDAAEESRSQPTLLSATSHPRDAVVYPEAAHVPGQTFIAAQSFRAPFHLSKSYWDGHALIVQIVNPTAGVLSGDTLETTIEVGQRAALLVTTPSATRVFHMKDGLATSRQQFYVAHDGWLEFWPEPLTLHERSRYRQTTAIEAHAGGEFFYGDFLLPGRMARGEAWAWDELSLELRVRIGGELCLKERLAQSGEGLKRLAAWAHAGEGAGFGNLVVASPRIHDSATWGAQINALQSDQVSIGVSRLRGSAPAYSIKFVAKDGEGLRSTLKQIREILRPYLPKLAADPRKL